MVARRFGTDHHVLRVESDAPALLDALGEAYDEPFADSSALATLAVARAAKEHVTVVLTGDGGDELFGGYDRYRAMRMAGNLRRRLGPMAAAAGRAGGIASRVPGAGRLAAASGFLRDPWAGYRDRMFHFTPTEVRRLLHPDLAAQVDVWAPVRRLDRLWADAGSQPWVPWIDAQSYLPDDLLTKMDRATMAFGVEARSPLLDHELWTWAATLPRDLLIDRKTGKLLMRNAYRGVLPDPVIDRAKMGFGVPLGAWLRSHLRSRLVAAPTGPLAGIVDPVAARAVVDRVLRGDDAFMYRAWNLLALATWLERRVAS
jgi:asparagine synthase (glutamine-hydrolysing)